MIYSFIYIFSLIFSLNFWLKTKQNLSYVYIAFISFLALIGTSRFVNEFFSGYFYRPELSEINKSHSWITFYLSGLWVANLSLKIIKKNKIKFKRFKLPQISQKSSLNLIAYLSLFFVFLLFSQFRDLQIFNLGEISLDLDRWDFRFLDRNNSFLQVLLVIGRATSYFIYIYGSFLIGNSKGFSRFYKYSYKFLLIILILFYGSATLDRAPFILSLLIIVLSPLFNSLFRIKNYNKRFLSNFLFTTILGFCSALFAFSLFSGLQYNEQLWILGGERIETGEELDIVTSFVGRIFLSPFFMMQKLPEDFSAEFSYIEILKNGRNSVDFLFAQPMTWIGDIRRNFGTFYVFLFAFIFQSVQIIFLNSIPNKLINRSLYLSSFLIFCLSFYGNFIGTLSFLGFVLLISSLII